MGDGNLKFAPNPSPPLNKTVILWPKEGFQKCLIQAPLWHGTATIGHN